MTAPTVESIATLAGRELDTAVSRALFPFRTMWCPKHGVAWEPVHIKDGHCIDGGGCGLAVQERTDNIPHYSTDPAAFFSLMEKVRENGWAYTMSERGGKCWAIIDRPVVSDAGENGLKCLTFEQHKGEAGPNQLPLAFARAALLTTINTPKGG